MGCVTCAFQCCCGEGSCEKRLFSMDGFYKVPKLLDDKIIRVKYGRFYCQKCSSDKFQLIY